MKSFKEYIFEADTTDQQYMNRQNVQKFRDKKQSQELKKQMDFEKPASQHSFNTSLPDKEKWPSKPLADWKAAQTRWSVSDGKRPQHLSKES
jgi:hypothetical protein